MAKDILELKIPNFKNPWMVSTMIIGIIALAAIVLLMVNYIGGDSFSYCTTSENPASSNQVAKQIGQNLVNTLNTQLNSTVKLYNVSEFSGIYQIEILYQNQTIPLYSTTDGKYLIQYISPIR